MPEIISYTPPWLSRPSPASKAFMHAPSSDPASERSTFIGSSPRESPDQPYYGSHRLLTRRGSEIFVVVGNEIRWLDLRRVKNHWEEWIDQAKTKNSLDEQQAQRQPPSYRVLLTPVYQQIRQLVVSPSGNFLAILTEHTVHIAILPDACHLAAGDDAPLKIKTHQLGPTTHVLPQSPVVAALWHPLAYSTTSLDCLVTVTAEAAVRVWELDSSNNWSFDRPSLAIDLQKLADGTSCDEDFEPSGFGKNKGFSADAFEMEVSAARFAGRGSEEEDGWAPMTLWIAMRSGDVYALCPLIPSKWRPVSTLIPSLSTSVVSKIACIDDDSTDLDEKRAVQQQLEWVQEIDSEEPTSPHTDPGSTSFDDIRSRPSAPSAIPRLQGPFLFDLEVNELDLEVSDIHVTAAKVNTEDLLSGEEEDYADLEGVTQDRLSTALICLATTSGKVHVCLEMEGVSGQWLSQSKRSAFTVPVGEPRDLVLVETIQFGNGDSGPQNWPLFSQDPIAPYDYYLTSSNRIDHFSLSTWASRLESELLVPDSPDSGLDFRLKVLCGDDIVLTEEIVNCSNHAAKDLSEHLSSSLIMSTPGVGYLLLSCSSSGPQAVIFDQPDTTSRALILARRSDSLSPTPTNALTNGSSEPESFASPLRSAYEPSPVFYKSPTGPLRPFLSANVPQRYRAALKQQIRLSPNTLDIMAAAHRILSSQTSELEQAAAELFRRCERIREELGDQVRQMAELSQRIQRSDPSCQGDDNDRDRNRRCEKRIGQAKERQQSLNERYEALRRKVGRTTAGGRGLSNKEKAWIREITDLAAAFAVDSDTEMHELEPGTENTIEARFQTVRDLAGPLLNEAQELHKDQPVQVHCSSSHKGRPSSSASTLSNTWSDLVIPPKLQRAKIEEAMQMVEREAMVIDAVMARLQRLG